MAERMGTDRVQAQFGFRLLRGSVKAYWARVSLGYTMGAPFQICPSHFWVTLLIGFLRSCLGKYSLVKLRHQCNNHERVIFFPFKSSRVLFWNQILKTYLCKRHPFWWSVGGCKGVLCGCTAALICITWTHSWGEEKEVQWFEQVCTRAWSGVEGGCRCKSRWVWHERVGRLRVLPVWLSAPFKVFWTL